MRVCVRTHKTLSPINFILRGKGLESIFVYSSNLLERRRYIHKIISFCHCYLSFSSKQFLKTSSTPFFQFVENPEEGWEFTCQNGPKECKGNMYQACLLRLPETQVDSTQQVQMINCIMSDATPDTATLKVNILL